VIWWELIPSRVGSRRGQREVFGLGKPDSVNALAKTW
jgi:hypothetical protein